MTARKKAGSLAAAAVLAGALGGVLAVALANRSEPRYRGSQPPARITLPKFDLTSYGGGRVASGDVKGKVVILTFLESRCREACPLIASQVADGLDLLTPDELRRVAPIAISTHPDDDTPASVRAFLRRHGAEGKIDYLIGSERDLRPVWEEAKILSALDSGEADTHSAPVRIYDREGTWVATLHVGADLTPENLAHDIRAALHE